MAQLQTELGGHQGRLERAEERLADLWEGGASEKLRGIAEGRVDEIRAQRARVGDDLAQAQQRLEVARARPTSQEAAAELRQRVVEFWRHLPEATAEQRRDFNRWLLARDPSIEFRVHPVEEGADKAGRGIELVVGGESASIEPLAGAARGLARQLGVVAPTTAIKNGEGLAYLEGRGIEGAIRQVLEQAGDGRLVDHSRTFELWQASAPIRPLVKKLMALLPQKLAEMGTPIEAQDPQQVMRLAILLAQQLVAGASPAQGGGAAIPADADRRTRRRPASRG